ncbi:MAG TPA: Crp/Fnr family transcriptional regulator [Mucilaginibacter sp.]|jgi:CRP-like cAMP-binding protein|nr:Crp/Fnr family transcriptional regulator [Mucilaginibacter sp.]
MTKTHTPDSPLNIDWDKYAHLIKEKTVPAKTILLNEGDVSRYGYFIKQGCLRLWFNNKGKDITFQFFFENEAVSSVESFRSGEPSLFSIESIEPTTVYAISKKNFEQIFMSNPGYTAFIQETMVKRMSHYSKLFMSYIKNTPEERYRELLENAPHIIKRVPQHYIASYLGITSVSLSRIRNRM